nr:hypothetical protein [Bradyrhizobium zhanjiangense]
MSKIALAKVMRDFVDSALLPLFRLREPENAALEIERSALSAQRFLTANFDQPIHVLHSLPVKPFTANEPNSVPNAPSHFFSILRREMGQQHFPCSAAVRSATSSRHHQ